MRVFFRLQAHAEAADSYLRDTLEELAKAAGINPEVNPLGDVGPMRNFQIVNALRDWITSHSG